MAKTGREQRGSSVGVPLPGFLDKLGGMQSMSKAAERPTDDDADEPAHDREADAEGDHAGTGSDGDAQHETDQSEAEADAEANASSSDAEAADFFGGSSANGGPAADDDGDGDEVAQPAAPAAPASPAAAPKAGGGAVTLLAGLLFAGGAFFAATAQAAGTPWLLAQYGLDAGSFAAFALIAFATAAVRRQVRTTAKRIEAALENQGADETVRADLRFLVDAQNALAMRPPAAGEELQRVLVTLQRQDEKINNLTKAIKMYGKPMMEIANQGSEVAGQIGQLRTHVEGTFETTRQGFARLEAQAKNAGGKKELEDLRLQSLKLEDQLQKGLAALAERMPRGDHLQQQLTRVEAVVQSLGQRVDDSDVRKSLLRLEDTTAKAREELHKLLQGEALQNAAHRLEQRVDSCTQKLQGGLDTLRNTNLGALETTVREIQREMSGVATSVAQIQSAVRSGGGRGGVAAAGPAHGMAPSHAPAHAPAPAAPAAGAHHAPAANPGATNDAQAGVAQNQTGVRATSSKNVLGAIAKLKQMKG